MQIYIAIQVLAEFDVLFEALYANELVFSGVGRGSVKRFVISR